MLVQFSVGKRCKNYKVVDKKVANIKVLYESKGEPPTTEEWTAGDKERIQKLASL